MFFIAICCQSHDFWPTLHWGNVNERGGKAECVDWTLWKASQRWIWLGCWSPVQWTSVRRPAYPNHYWHGEEGHLKDEVWQSCRSIRHSGGGDQGSRWYRCHHDPRSCYCDYPWWQGPNWLGGKFHCLPLQGQGWCFGSRQLSRPQADWAGHEDPREDCRWSHKTGGVYWRLPVWLCPRKRHYRSNLCGPAAAGEIPSSEQEALYSLPGPRESIWPCPS